MGEGVGERVGEGAGAKRFLNNLVCLCVHIFFCVFFRPSNFSLLRIRIVEKFEETLGLGEHPSPRFSRGFSFDIHLLSHHLFLLACQCLRVVPATSALLRARAALRQVAAWPEPACFSQRAGGGGCSPNSLLLINFFY